ncbi:MAG: class I SAM-dependent methyltransferase [Duodenibacillus sp.]
MARSLDWDSFVATAAGRTVRAWEEDAFARFVSGVRGDRALQLGLTYFNPLAMSPIVHRIAASEHVVAQAENDLRVRLVCRPEALPLESESCDLVVWPHGPDVCAEHFSQVLAEVERVLAPNGVLVLTLFNSLGSWKLREKFFATSHVLPDGAAQVSLVAVKAALKATTLTLEGGNFGVYAVNTQAAPSAGVRLPTWIDKAGDRWWPTLANVVLLSARKQTTQMKMVGKINFAPTRSLATSGAVAHKEAARTDAA